MPEFELLLERFLQNDLDPAGLSRFLSAVKEPENLDILRRVLSEKLQQKAYTGLSEKGDIDPMFHQMLVKAGTSQDQENRTFLSQAALIPVKDSIQQDTLQQTGRSYRLFKRSAAAAAILLFLGAGAYLLFNHNNPQPIAVKVSAPALKNDVEPGGNKAILTLSDGSKISLTGAGNGTLAQQGNTKVVKLANGQLAYRAAGKGAGQPPNQTLYNTMTTPRGGQYKLTLPDGTQVWLNASSSITYPTGFTGKERTVEMMGEAYFEVAPNARMPFKVKTDGMEVDVFGTHFNVNAYRDESVKKTTLLEGAVKVVKGADAALLKPGQQATCGGTGSKEGINLVEDADVEESVAWKNGLFSFNGADLPLIMRQLARWYDLDVRYEGTMPKRRFTGKVFRNLKLSETLKILELNQIHFRIEGNRLTVTP